MGVGNSRNSLVSGAMEGCRIFAFGDVQPCGEMRRYHHVKRLERDIRAPSGKGRGVTGWSPPQPIAQGYGQEVGRPLEGAGVSVASGASVAPEPVLFTPSLGAQA